MLTAETVNMMLRHRGAAHFARENIPVAMVLGFARQESCVTTGVLSVDRNGVVTP
jgi:hypothetical protein